MNPTALQVHRDTLIVDGLVFIIGEFVRAFGNDIRTRHLEDCASHGELVRLTSALLERGWSEAELRGFLGENLLRALDLAWAPP